MTDPSLAEGKDAGVLERELGALSDGSVDENKQAVVAIVKKPKDDAWKLAHEGERVQPAELLDEGYVDIARLEPGACFGELALVDGRPRMATIKCLTRCHFLILNRADYAKSLREQEKKHRQQKVTIIQKIPIFQRLTKTFVHNKLAPHFYEMHCIRGQHLFKQGDEADRVYIICGGQFLITKNTDKQEDEEEEYDVLGILQDPKSASKS